MSCRLQSQPRRRMQMKLQWMEFPRSSRRAWMNQMFRDMLSGHMVYFDFRQEPWKHWPDVTDAIIRFWSPKPAVANFFWLCETHGFARPPSGRVLESAERHGFANCSPQCNLAFPHSTKLPPLYSSHLSPHPLSSMFPFTARFTLLFVMAFHLYHSSPNFPVRNFVRQPLGLNCKRTLLFREHLRGE